LTAFGVAAAYAVASGVYILTSDRFLALFEQDLSHYQYYQTAKGWAFVALTSLALWLVLRAAWSRLQSSLDAASLAEDRLRAALDAAGGCSWQTERQDDGVLRIGAEGGLARALGMSGEPQLDVQVLRKLIHPDDFAAYDAHVAAIAREDDVVPTLVCRVRIDDTTYRWVKVVPDVGSRARGGKGRLFGVTLDITDQQETAQSLADVIAGGELGTWRHDVRNNRLYVNDRWAEMLGYSLKELNPQTIGDWRALVHPEDMADLGQVHAQKFATRDYFFSSEFRMRRKDGGWLWVLSRGRAVEIAESGEVEVLSGVHIDISRRKALEAELLAKTDFLQRLTETSVSGIVVFDATGTIVFANLEAQQILDISGKGLVGRRQEDLRWRMRGALGSEPSGIPLARIERQGDVMRDLRLILPGVEGAERVISVNAAPMRALGGPAQVVCSVSDITQRLRDERRLALAAEEARHASLHDSLTGLPNREMFRDALATAIRATPADSGLLVQVFLSIDQFQQIKDRFGPFLGDRVICQVAERFDRLRAQSQVLARVGAEEFTLLGRCGAIEEIGLITETLAAAFDTPFDLEGQPVYLTASIGASIYPMDAMSADEMWLNADLAMYEAKAMGGNRCVPFTAKLRDRMARDAMIGQSLLRAIRDRAFELVLQPKVDLQAANRVAGAEVLLRCTEPSLKGVGPADFMPVAEKTGLIRAIDLLVVEMVGVFLAGLKERGLTLRLSINLSPESLRQAEFGKDLLARLDSSNLTPEQVFFELTEGAVVDMNSDARGNIELLLARGFELSADDFGTGYSSLSYLQRLRLRELKIDQSFVSRLGTDAGASDAIVRATLAMAKALGLRTVAEGIDTPEQELWLREHGCDFGQGYLFARPMPPEEFVRSFLEAPAASGAA